MRILHTSDWHLGKRLERFSRLEEQREVMDEICQIADSENVDAVIIAGDIYDTFNPPTEAVELFYKTVKRLAAGGKRPVIAIAGNHDSPDRIEAPDPLARECGILLSGLPYSEQRELAIENGFSVSKTAPGFLEVILPEHDFPLRVITTPFANEFRLRKALNIEDSEAEFRDILEQHWNELADKYCDGKGVNMLLTHLFMVKKGDELPDEPDDEKPILYVGGAQPVYTANIPKNIQYTALGHLHRFSVVSETEESKTVYSGTPLSYSMSEAGQDKGVVIADIEPGNVLQTKFVSLQKGKKLAKKVFSSVDEAVEWLAQNQNSLVEITIECDEYLRADERKSLSEAHAGIVAIIPRRKKKDAASDNQSDGPDLSMNIDELFSSFFESKYDVSPSDEIKALFKEVLGGAE